MNITKNKCPNCGYENTDDSNFCRSCGTDLNTVIKGESVENKNVDKESSVDFKVKDFVKKYKMIIVVAILISISVMGGIILSKSKDDGINLDKEYVNIMRKKLNVVGIVNKNEQNIIIAYIEGMIYYNNRLGGEYITIEDAIDEIFEYPEFFYETIEEFKEEGIEDVNDVKVFLENQFMEEYEEEDKSSLVDPTDLGAKLLENDKEEQTMSTENYFYNLRTQKAESDEKSKEEMELITKDLNASKEAKDIAIKWLNEKNKLQEQEVEVEREIINKGYIDAICMIDSNKVTIYVHVKSTPTIEETNSLQQLVEDITELSDIQIEMKK